MFDCSAQKCNYTNFRTCFGIKSEQNILQKRIFIADILTEAKNGGLQGKV